MLTKHNNYIMFINYVTTYYFFHHMNNISICHLLRDICCVVVVLGPDVIKHLLFLVLCLKLKIKNFEQLCDIHQ